MAVPPPRWTRRRSVSIDSAIPGSKFARASAAIAASFTRGTAAAPNASPTDGALSSSRSLGATIVVSARSPARWASARHVSTAATPPPRTTTRSGAGSLLECIRTSSGWSRRGASVASSILDAENPQVALGATSGVSAAVEHALVDGVADELRASGEAQLLHDVRAMRLGGSHRDVELGGDLLVRVPLRQEPEHLPL